MAVILLSLIACDLIDPYLREVRTPPEEVSFSGNVMDSPLVSDVLFSGAGEGGMVWRFDEVLVEGEPYEVLGEENPSSPGYWGAVLPAGERYQLRIDGGEGYYPAVFQDVAPAASALWFTGAIFGWPVEQAEPWLVDTSAQLGVSLGGGGVAHLWGYIDPDSQETFDPSLLEIVDGEGALAVAAAWDVAEDGSWVLTDAPPAVYFLAFNLAPGDVTLSLGDLSVTYTDVRGGDLITPWSFVVP